MSLALLVFKDCPDLRAVAARMEPRETKVLWARPVVLENRVQL